MSEETSERPKPDRSVTPLPKVLVQQASEEKSEAANDIPTSNGPEYAQVQDDAPLAETPIANAPEPSPETGESSKPQEQANGAHAPPESVENKPDAGTPKADQPNLEADGLSTDAIVGDDATGTFDALHHMEIEPEVSVNVDVAETQNHDEVLRSSGDRPRSKSPREPNDVSSNEIIDEGQTGEKPTSPIERSRSKTPESANVGTTPSHEVFTDNKESHEKLATPTEINPEDGDRTLSKTPEAASSVSDKESQPTTGNVIAESHLTAQEIPASNIRNILGSPTPSVRSEAKGFNDHEPTGGDLTLSFENQEPGKLLQMVVNGETGLITPTGSDRITPTLDKDEDFTPASDRSGEDDHLKTPVKNPEEVESVQTSAGESQTDEKQDVHEADPDLESNAANKAGSLDFQGGKNMSARDEAGSVTSEERAEAENHDAYDASVSGNEDDVYQNPPKTSVGEGDAVKTHSPGSPRSATPDTTKITRPTSPELQTEDQVTAAATNPTPKEPGGNSKKPSLASPTIQSSQRSSKVVKFASDWKTSPGSDSDSDAVVTPLGKTTEIVNDIAKHHMLQDSFVNQTVELTLEDLEEVEGLDTRQIEKIENPRKAESSSALSTHTNDSENDRKTVVEYEMNDLTASSSHVALLDQIRREKDAEMEALKDKIQVLRDDMKTLHKEKEAEHQKVTDMSLQIRRMEGDNTNNFKTIQNYELKVRTLEDKLEKHNTSLAQQERQVRNGTTTTTAAPTATTKKSSVCVIL